MTAVLVNLEDVKAWLNLTRTTESDGILKMLVTSSTAAVLNFLNRDAILPARCIETYNGDGRPGIMLRNWPVTSINSLTVDGVKIPVGARIIRSNVYEKPNDIFSIPDVFAPRDVFSSMNGAQAVGVGDLTYEKIGSGYVLDYQPGDAGSSMQLLSMNLGGRFQKGRSNIIVDYMAGYRIASEPAEIPSVGPYTVKASAPLGGWTSDISVAYAGTREPLVKVTANPEVGQYTVSNGTYTFNAGNQGEIIEISYGFAPAAIQQAIISWASEQFKYRDRIGVRSKSLGGQETVSYDTSAVPGYVRQILQDYVRVVPC